MRVTKSLTGVSGGTAVVSDIGGLAGGLWWLLLL